MTPPVVLTLDLGTSTTKAALWHGAELVAITRAELTTDHPAPGHAEQDPEAWWASVVDACTALRSEAADLYASVALVACSAARETFALVDESLMPLGPGILWSDHRAGAEVDALGDPAEFRRATGVVCSPGCAVAKVAWVARHDPDAFAAARWILAPRDLVVARLTGTVRTDPSLASRTGWTTLAGELRADPALASRLPPIAPSTSTLPRRDSAWTRMLALPANARVVPGAGDRACEAVGAGAARGCPLVSWGTTANVSVPHPGPVADLPTVAQVSRAADAGFLVEAGLAAAGAAFDWLASVTDRGVDDLWALAAVVPPGADGVTAFPWFAGARAPHWRADATAAFAGLRPHHSPAELARALVEGVAFDVVRSLELLDPHGAEVVVTGGGAANATWRAVLGDASGRTVLVRRHTEAGSVGARLLAALATGEALALDAVNPIVDRRSPDDRIHATYRERLGDADRIVVALLAETSDRGETT